MKKRFFAMTIALAMILALSACGSKQTTNPADPAESSDAASENYVIKFAHTDSEESTTHYGAAAFKRIVEEKTNGRITVEIYPNGQLGDDPEVLEAIQLGTVDMTVCGASRLSNFDQVFCMMDLPFLFESYDEMTAAVVDGDLGKIYSEKAEENGFKVLGFLYDGARCISNNIRPIYSVEDCKGLKIRVMQNDLYINLMKAFDATPTPMGMTELYSALSSGVVDGQDNPPALGYAAKLHEVQKYYSWTRHTFQNAPLCLSKAFFDKLPADLQEAVIESGREAADEQREYSSSQETAYQDMIAEEGCQTNEVTDIASFQNASRVVYVEFRSTVGDEMMDQILTAADKLDVYK